MQINLADLKNSRFKFHIEDSLRFELFEKLHDLYGDWKLVARNLNINTRALFGLRRGWNIDEGKQVQRFIRAETFFHILEVLGIEPNFIQNRVEVVEIGNKRERIRFPVEAQMDKLEFNSVSAYIFEYVFSRRYESALELLHSGTGKGRPDNYTLYITREEILNRMRELTLRGMQPALVEHEDRYELSYRMPGRSSRAIAILPKTVKFDEHFAKEFGKWIGDRAGGPHKVGVSNKDRSFMESFQEFLIKSLLQPADKVKMELVCRPDFRPSEELVSFARSLSICKTQYGEYSFVVTVANKLLRDLVFNVFERFLFRLLLGSPREVRMAFYAGLLEADGSVSRTVDWAFGVNLRRIDFSANDCLEKLKEATRLKFLLEKDGFSAIVSRKTSKSIVKYDVKILCNNLSAREDIDSFKELATCITYPYKLSRANELIKFIENGGIK